jgi:integrase/recombinase XerD
MLTVRLMAKAARERYIPLGYRLAEALLKYKLEHRPTPVGTVRFWWTVSGTPLEVGRIEKMVKDYGRKADLKRCYPHKLRHTSAVLYLRNGGNVSSLQKKLINTRRA